MWSILTDGMPEYISVEDVVWPVKTDFRVWLRVGQILSRLSPDMSPEGQFELVRDIFDLVIPEGEKLEGVIIWASFFEAVSKFYAGPMPDEPDPGPEPNKPAAKRQFDFSYDSALIYQSFASFYHIRLAEADMHWWEFLTLFNGFMLNDQNNLNFVVGVRQRKMDTVPKQQRAAYVKMKRNFALPQSEKQKEAQNAVFENLEKMWTKE